MCGIFGFAGPFSFRAAALLQALAIADESRGKHSTGLGLAARMDGSKRLEGVVVKKALAGSEFVRAGFTSVLFQRRYGLAIGHNRYATAGAVNDRNAHPFRIHTAQGAVLAAHNGIVGGKELIAREFGVPDCPVDSEVLFRAIGRLAGATESSLVDAIEKVVSFIAPRADFACLWLSPARRSLYLFRSDERPLVVFDGRKVGLGRFFASTVPIFSEAWGTIRGCLPSLKRISYFEAKPHAVYRVADDGNWEVERIRDIKVAPRASEPATGARQELFSWPSLPRASADADDEEEEQRYFTCAECGGPVETEDAVDGEKGKHYHPDCQATLSRRSDPPPRVAF